MSLKVMKIMLGVLGAAVFLMIGGWLVFSLSYLSLWKPTARAQLWLDKKIAGGYGLVSDEAWLPGKIRIGEAEIQGRKLGLYFANAEVRWWSPLNGVLLLRPVGSPKSVTVHVRRGGLEADPHGTLVFLPQVIPVSLKEKEVRSFLVPDFQDASVSGKSTWSLLFCPADTVQVGWEIDKPLLEIADIFGNLKEDVSVEAEVIFRYFRRSPCDW